MEVVSAFKILGIKHDLENLQLIRSKKEANKLLSQLKKIARSKFRRLSHLYHPDKKTGNRELFEKAKQAYDIIKKIRIEKNAYYNANVVGIGIAPSGLSTITKARWRFTA